MKFRAEINIMPQPALLDPQGKAVQASMKNIGIPEVYNVRIGKHITVELDTDNKEKAIALIEEACKKLLSNPITELYHYEIEVL